MVLIFYYMIDKNTNDQGIHKKTPTSLSIREMQIKTTLISYQILVWRGINKMKHDKCWWGCVGQQGKCKIITLLWKTSMVVPWKTETKSTLWSSNVALGTYPKKLKWEYQRNTYTIAFIVLFMIAMWSA